MKKINKIFVGLISLLISPILIVNLVFFSSGRTNINNGISKQASSQSIKTKSLPRSIDLPLSDVNSFDYGNSFSSNHSSSTSIGINVISNGFCSFVLGYSQKKVWAKIWVTSERSHGIGVSKNSDLDGDFYEWFQKESLMNDKANTVFM